MKTKAILISENKNLYNFHRVYTIYDYKIIFKVKTKNIKNSLIVILLKNNKNIFTHYLVDYINRKQKLKEIIQYIMSQNER